jgi:ribosomal protein L10
MATRTEKDQAIELLVEEIKATSVLYLADTTSMNAEATSNLRRACNKAGIRMKVVKNTLLQKAMERVEGRDYSGLFPTLKGQTSILFPTRATPRPSSSRISARRTPSLRSRAPGSRRRCSSATTSW